MKYDVLGLNDKCRLQDSHMTLLAFYSLSVIMVYMHTSGIFQPVNLPACRLEQAIPGAGCMPSLVHFLTLTFRHINSDPNETKSLLHLAHLEF